MEGLGIGFALLFILNFAISWFNAWSCGRAWADSKVAGGFSRLVVWCGATMSACGFTWCYLFILALLAGTIPYKGHILLPAPYVKGMLELGYMVIILPVLGSGLGITAHSWLVFKRNKSVLNGGVAVYNTFAQVYNTVNAFRAMPPMVGDLSKLFGGKKDNAVWVMVLLVIAALLGGILTTTAIIRTTAKNYAYQVKYDLREKLAEAGAR